ncbi:MAG: ParA family protein [Acidithiobacillus sp.]|nr:ParA family protein [Acidithiobacillus sp.]
MTKCITVTNQKGGVGKTALSVHIAQFAAKAMGMKTLLVDLDGQQNSSFAATGKSSFEHTVIELWDGEAEIPAGISTRFDFDLLPGPAAPDATGIDEEETRSRESGKSSSPAKVALSRLLTTEYDLIVFDTPPAPGPRQIAPLGLGGLLLAPIEPDIAAFQGITTLYKLYQRVAAGTDLQLKLVINKRILNSANQTQVIQALRGSVIGKYMMMEELTSRVLVQNAMREGKAIWDVDRKDPLSAILAQVCKKCVEGLKVEEGQPPEQQPEHQRTQVGGLLVDLNEEV